MNDILFFVGYNDLFLILMCSYLMAGLWSFAALRSDRLYKKNEEKEDIKSKRSLCFNCKRQLKFYEVLPIFSYIFLRWKCSGCKTSIPKKLFLTEISFYIFTLISSFCFFFVNFNLNWTDLFFWLYWLHLLVLFLILQNVVHDCFYKEVEYKFTLPLFVLLYILVLLNDFKIVGFIHSIQPTITSYYLEATQFSDFILPDKVIGWITYVGSTLWTYISEILVSIWYFFLFLSTRISKTDKEERISWIYQGIWILIWIYAFTFIPQGQMTLLVNSYLGSVSIWLFFLFIYIITKWRWMWWGDFQFALILWLLLGNLSLIWLALAFITACVWSIIILIYRKIKGVDSSEIPFWPYLFLGYWIIWSGLLLSIVKNPYFLLF